MPLVLAPHAPPSGPQTAAVPAPILVHRRIRPAPAADLPGMTRYRGGTYSHTVGTVIFSDGSSARTDLIRLNPNLVAYSLDISGAAPRRPARYRADTWAGVPHLQTRAHEAEVDWVLRHSYPAVPVTVLSDRLRAAGYPLGVRNIAEHEAIAGTQAAIWHYCNGLDLDRQPLDVPILVSPGADGVDVEFDEDRQLSGYSAHVDTVAGAVLRLRKSVDNETWQDVAASAVAVPPGGGRVGRSLGVGSTVSHRRYARRAGGHRYYRVVVEGGAAISGLTFRLEGSSRFRNPEPVVHLYQYLLAGARRARDAAVPPQLEVAAAGVEGDVVGPFRLLTTATASVSVPKECRLTNPDGTALIGPVSPGQDFFLKTAPGATGATLSFQVPSAARGFGGRVITGVVRDDFGGGHTPLALAVPARLLVDFELQWVPGCR